jgi:hypothetical protein
MKAKSIKGKTKDEIQIALQDSISEKFKPTLAVVFMSIKIDHNEIVSILDAHNIQIFGATTNGEFIDEELGSESIAILLLDLDSAYFNIHFETYADLDFRGAGQRVAHSALNVFSQPGFLISGSHMETDAEAVVRGIEDINGNETILFGGMAGDDFMFKNQRVFTNGKESMQGLIALVLDNEKVEIKGRALCGWKAMGTEKTVTKSFGNHLYTIDNIPVLDIIAKYGGIDVSPQNEKFLLEMATLCPLQLMRESSTPIMRPCLAVDWDDRSAFTSGTVPQGSKVKFCLPPDFDVIEEVINGCKDLKEREMPEADAIIYFTCAGRLLTFGPLMEQEIEGIKSVWDVPLVGMFSNSELGRTKGGNLELHNLTTCCVALRER